MLTVDQALETILDHINKLEAENCYLLASSGQIAAEDVNAEIDVPGWNGSALDGFAVRAEDIKGSSPQNPRILRVIETVMAGFIAKNRVSQGTAVRIMTGAPLPEGADCVVGFEDTDEQVRSYNKQEMPVSEIGIQREQKAGANIRKAGEQIAGGSQLIPQGRQIGPAEIGILASLGHTQARVIRRPIVAIIATGEELAMPGKPLSIPQIYNGNSFNIAAQVLRCGGMPKILGISRDTKSAITAKICRGMDADMIITTGGVSTGDHDLVKDILNEMGEIIFWRVRMSPGKSFTFALVHKQGADGNLQKIPHFALTGNPPASMINFEVLVRPAILKMAGRSDLGFKMVEAIMEDSIGNTNSSRRFVWVTIKERNNIFFAKPTSSQVKGVITSISLADGLAIIPEEIAKVKKGEKLKVALLNWH